MKPLNLNKESCNPISSNCVVWQGPEIECINLCKGDTVTDVVYKLAMELCALMETFDIDNYDITCFNLLECAPKDFQELIQLLITKVCECCGVTPEPTPGGVGCPDCEVTICPEFYYENPQGDTITTMQLDDYVVAIGNRVCQIIGQIDTINSTLENHEERIEVLENAPAPVVVLPQITPDCVLPPIPTDMDVVLDALETQFCELRVATGDPTAIYEAMLKQCAGLNQSPQLTGSGIMQDIPGWAAAVSNMSDAMGNMWLTICDIRGSIQTIQATCCDNGCDGIIIMMTAVLNSPNELQLNFTGSVPVNFVDCVGGSSITITDGIGGTTTFSINVISTYLNDPGGYLVDITTGPVNGNYDITSVLTLCAIDNGDGTTCQTVATAFAAAAKDCPPVILIPGLDTIDYSLIYTGATPVAVDVQLWNTAQTVMVANEITNATVNGQPIAGQFTGLTNGTLYYVRVVLDGNSDCPFDEVTTLNALCVPPVNGGIVEIVA